MPHRVWTALLVSIKLSKAHLHVSNAAWVSLTPTPVRLLVKRVQEVSSQTLPACLNASTANPVRMVIVTLKLLVSRVVTAHLRLNNNRQPVYLAALDRLLSLRRMPRLVQLCAQSACQACIKVFQVRLAVCRVPLVKKLVVLFMGAHCVFLVSSDGIVLEVPRRVPHVLQVNSKVRLAHHLV